MDAQRHIHRPFAFIFHYARQRPLAHGIILASVLAAVICSVCTQYGVKKLVDVLSGADTALGVWGAFALLVSLIAADNLLWRLASWIGSYAFVGVTGDVRRDLFRHLTGHSPSYFTNRLPGTLSSRITATSNAIYTVENMFIWNVLPPCAATVAAIALMVTVSATDGRKSRRCRGPHGVRDVPPGSGRQAAASRLRRQGRRYRRRDG